MTLLLDTHVFLWWLDDPERLSKQARKAIGDSRNTVYVSAADVSEIEIKRAPGKLEVPHDFGAMMIENRFLPLPVTIAHALILPNLPNHHRHPVDRMLIAQAVYEGFDLVSRISYARLYDVSAILA